MNILFLGPQGSGKGTQAKLLSDKFNLFYFEAGEFLRKIAESNEVLRKILDEGELVPGEELTSYISAFFDEEEIYDDIIFDGFPRFLEEYLFFKKWLEDKKVKLDLVFVINVTKETTIKRLQLRKREDDTKETIEKRLELYNKETVPLIEELKKEIKVVEVDGERSVEEIFKNICKKLH